MEVLEMGGLNEGFKKYSITDINTLAKFYSLILDEGSAKGHYAASILQNAIDSESDDIDDVSRTWPQFKNEYVLYSKSFPITGANWLDFLTSKSKKGSYRKVGKNWIVRSTGIISIDQLPDQIQKGHFDLKEPWPNQVQQKFEYNHRWKAVDWKLLHYWETQESLYKKAAWLWLESSS